MAEFSSFRDSAVISQLNFGGAAGNESQSLKLHSKNLKSSLRLALSNNNERQNNNMLAV